MRLARDEDGFTLEADGGVQAFEGCSRGVWAKGDGVEAEVLEVFDDVGPQGDIRQPVIVRSLRQRAVADEEDATRVVKLGAKGQIGGNTVMVFDGWRWRDI